MMIIRQDDPAVVELKRIVETQLALKCQFLYANLAEANFGLDQIKQMDIAPIFIFFANDKSQNKTTETGLIVRTIPVVGMMLQPIELAAADYSSAEAAPYINEMRELNDNMVYNINKSPLSYKPEPVTEWSFDKVYAKFDKYLFGGGTQFNWAFNTGKRGC
jgi:hypothetical protein